MDGGAFMSDMINEGTASVTFKANEEEEVEQEEGNEEVIRPFCITILYHNLLLFIDIFHI
jgi:hypothetical protein